MFVSNITENLLGDEALAFNLSHCVFSRSVPVVQLPQVSLPAPPVVQAPQSAPAPQIVYVPQPAPPPAPESVYASPPAPEPAPRPASAPDKLQMNCRPEHSASYFVTYNGHAGTVLVTESDTGRTLPYPVRGIHDNTGVGVFYVNAKRNDQNRTMFFAFNYSNDGGDGGIRVKGVNSDGTYMDARDACTPVQN